MRVLRSKTELESLSVAIGSEIIASFSAMWIGPFLKLKPIRVLGRSLPTKIWIELVELIVQSAHAAVRAHKSRIENISLSDNAGDPRYCLVEVIVDNGRALGAIVAICQCSTKDEAGQRFEFFRHKLNSQLREYDQNAASFIKGAADSQVEQMALHKDWANFESQLLRSNLFRAKWPFRMTAAFIALCGVLAVTSSSSTLRMQYNDMTSISIFCFVGLGVIWFGYTALTGRWLLIGFITRLHLFSRRSS